MGSLAAALVEAQKKMPSVAKGAKANYGNYATLDAIIAGTRDVLNDHGLAISQFPSETTTGGPGLKTVLLHGESGESIEATVPLLLNGKHDMQALGGAITYARRYGWAAVLGIANDEDDDGQQISAPAQSAGASPKASEPVGSGKGAGAASSPAPAFTPPATASAAISEANGDWEWPSGKHQGKALKDTPLDYVIWYAEKGPKEDVRQKCSQFLTPAGSGASIQPDGYTDPDDIPFDRTIDGLGN